MPLSKTQLRVANDIYMRMKKVEISGTNHIRHAHVQVSHSKHTSGSRPGSHHPGFLFRRDTAPAQLPKASNLGGHSSAAPLRLTESDPTEEEQAALVTATALFLPRLQPLLFTPRLPHTILFSRSLPLTALSNTRGSHRGPLRQERLEAPLPPLGCSLHSLTAPI